MGTVRLKFGKKIEQNNNAEAEIIINILFTYANTLKVGF